MKVFETSTSLRLILDHVRKGDANAISELFSKSIGRLKQLAYRMFSSRKHLHHFEEADDLLQDALLRLHDSTLKLKPDSTRAFMTLALQNIRWALRDLARDMRKGKQEFPIGNIGSTLPELESPAGEPESLLEWEHFHASVESLPKEEREVFELVYYSGLSQDEIAKILSVSTRTVKRRWRTARSTLGKILLNEWPPIG